MLLKVNDNGTLRQFDIAQISDLSDFITANDVPDIQINGTSIINNGVANIPIGRDALGAVYIASGGSDGISISTNGVATINPASTTQIKNSTQTPRPITPNNEDHATFYGLAKAAGDTSQAASSNTVGVYTDDAKVAIQKMLGTYEAPWELIREDTFTNATEANHVITVDGNGQTLELTDAIFLFETPVQETDSAKGSYGQIKFSNNDNYPLTVECGAWTQTANASAHGCGAIIENKNNLFLTSQAMRNTTSSNGMTEQVRYISGLKSTGSGVVPNPYYPNQYIINKIDILKVTGTGHYILYGKRKWT